MSPKIKALVYNFFGFAPIYFIGYVLLVQFTTFTGFAIPALAAFAAIILAPKFQMVKTQSGDKVFMKWLFLKGVREMK
jgi:hypothetical protein